MTATAADYTDYNVIDILKWSLTTMDGTTINESTYAGKFRIYAFVSCTCTNSMGTVMRLAKSEWISNDDIKVIVIFDDFSTMEEKQNFIESYGYNNKDIIFAYGNYSSIMRKFYVDNTINLSNLNYAICAVVDKNNIIRRAIESCTYNSADAFFNSAISKYLYPIEQNDMVTFDINGIFDYDEAYNVFTELNALRQKLGLSALTFDKELTDAAMQRAAEISIYYSHTRPNGSQPFTVFPPGGFINAENIAVGQMNAKEAMNGWTNSPGHYKNMTLDNIDSVGIGCFYQEGGVKHWVQLFDGGRKSIPDTRKGKEVKNAEIAAVGSYLDINIKSLSSLIGVSQTQKYELYNKNKEYPEDTTIIPKIYSSSDTNVATVDSQGLVTGIKEGSAWISLGFKGDVYWKKIINVENGYKITYDANGGKNAPAPQFKIKNHSQKFSDIKPSRDFYTFKGWSTNPKTTQPMYKAGDTIPENINKDLYLYAVWQPVNCYINYDTQGGKIKNSTQIVQYNTPTKVHNYVPTKTGYKFLGWATTKGAKTVKYKPGDQITVKDKYLTLYAVWQKIS